MSTQSLRRKTSLMITGAEKCGQHTQFLGTLFLTARGQCMGRFFTGRGVPKARVCLIRHLRKYNIYVAHTVKFWHPVKFGTNRTAHWKKRSQAPSGKEYLGEQPRGRHFESWPSRRRSGQGTVSQKSR